MPLFGEKEELVAMMLNLGVHTVTVRRDEKNVYDCKIYNNDDTVLQFAFMAQQLQVKPQQPQPATKEPEAGTGKEVTEAKPETKPAESKADPPKEPEKKKPDSLRS